LDTTIFCPEMSAAVSIAVGSSPSESESPPQAARVRARAAPRPAARAVRGAVRVRRLLLFIVAVAFSRLGGTGARESAIRRPEIAPDLHGHQRFALEFRKSKG